MKKFLSVRQTIAFFAVLVFTALTAQGQTLLYVRSGATGSNNGADWNNAYSALPGSLQRGAIYYIAAGSYGSHTFQDAASGTNQITIRKATVADHGTATGWQASYATGQAIFQAPLTFLADYYTIDGQYRTDYRSGHGIKVKNNAPISVSADGCIQIGTSNPQYAAHITIRYVEVDGSHDRSNGSADEGVEILWGSHYETIQYCALHDFGNCCMFLRGSVGTTIEENWLDRNHSTSAVHAEGISVSEKMMNWTCRYNVFEDMEGTAFIASAAGTHQSNTNWWVYGNVFAYTAGNATSSSRIGGCGDGVFALFDQDFYGDVFFYNNTIVNFNDAAVGGPAGGNASSSQPWTMADVEIGLGYPTPFQRLYVKNNLWVNSQGDVAWTPTGGSGVTDYQWDHNTYINSGNPVDPDPNKVYGTGSPLVNWTGGDYHLAAATTAGVSLAAPYNTDMEGNTRGSDGLWDRGAYEFGAVNTNPPVISGMAGSAISPQTATIAWTTDKAATSGVKYGLTASYGSTVTNAALVTSHSLSISNLTAGTTYHYAVASMDSSSHLAVSADSTLTTPTPDTTPPTVSLTAPVAGATVVGAIALTATASDNVAVAGVQFLVDGVAAGAEVTSAPYTYNWNSGTVSNGTHSITARARDTSNLTKVSSAVSVSVQNMVPNGLSGYWTFDDGSGTSAKDISGQNGTASLLNGAAWGAPAVGTGSLALNGTNAAYASVPDSTALQASGDLSISMWVKHTTLPPLNSWMYYVEKGQDSLENYAVGAYTDAGGTRLFFEFVDSTSTYRYLTQGTGATVAAGAWQQVSVIFDHTHGQLSFYNNGTQVASVATTQALQATATPLVIGEQNMAGYPFPMNGLIDDLRIYNRALASTEVGTLASMSTQARPPAPLGLRVIQ